MVNMYKLKLTILQQEILRFLFIKAGMSFNARGLARQLEVSQPGIMKALPELEKENLVKAQKDKDSGRWSIELNRDNKMVIELKRAENLKMLYESGLADFLEETFPGCTIILFGSYSRGEDILTNETDKEKSDIDIAIIGAREKEIDLTKFDKRLERIVFLHFNPNLKEVHKNLRESILNGILLAGGVEI